MSGLRGILSTSWSDAPVGDLAGDIEAAMSAIEKQPWPAPCGTSERPHLLHPDAAPGSRVGCANLCGALVEVPADWAERTARMRAALAEGADRAR